MIRPETANAVSAGTVFSGRNSPRLLLLAMLPIGDSICMLPAIRALRSRFPRARITAVACTGNAPLLQCAREIDDVLVLPSDLRPRSPATLGRLIATLRARRYDAAINFSGPAFKWISLLSASRVRISMKHAPLWWLLPGDRSACRNTHLTEQYYQCAAELGLPPWNDVDQVPCLKLPASARAGAAAFLTRHGLDHPGVLLVGMHAGGTWLGGLKRWPATHFASLASLLRERYEARVLVLGGEEDRALAAQIGGRDSQGMVCAAGELPLLTSLALVEHCGLFIGNDSALLHAAAALDTPFIGLFGPTCPDTFRPVARVMDRGTVLVPDRPCRQIRYPAGGDVIWRSRCCHGACAALSALSVERVYREAATLLARWTVPQYREVSR